MLPHISGDNRIGGEIPHCQQHLLGIDLTLFGWDE